MDRQRAGMVDDGALAAWRTLVTDNAINDRRTDPDDGLTAARHRSKGKRIAFALAWDREKADAETRHGVVPLSTPHLLWGRAEARLWHPPGIPHPAAALIDARRAEAVETVIRGRLAALRRPFNPTEPARRPVRVAEAAGRPGTIPTNSLVGVRTPDYVASSEVEQVGDPARIPAALEEFLALDARHAAQPIIADPPETSMVRVVTRLFGRRGQMRIELARRAGKIVAGTLHLSAGARAVVRRHAAGV